MNYITSYCHISSNKCWINGKEFFGSDLTDDFIKELYSLLEIKYSKFHKMDQLSKIAFVGSELIKRDLSDIDDYNDDDIALLFSNKTSSAVTDVNFQESYQNGGSPSPSLFVYTLPNILMGEIAIRNKWYGENMFTISPNFDATYFTNYCNLLLDKNAQASLCGWVNVDNGKVESFFFFVAKKNIKQLNLPLDSTRLMELFQEIKLD